MADSAKPRRFKVALSFPGEHRDRVEKIANLLAKHIDRDRILYDRWYREEFAVMDFDIDLQKLYHDESDLVVCFLCKKYTQKE